MTRQEANREIINYILLYIKIYPEWRFEQILSNLGITEVDFYKESSKTLEIVKYGDSLIKYE